MMSLSVLSTSNKPEAIFLDANVLIEIILARSNQQKAIEYLKRSAPAQLHISALTAHLVVHFGQKVAELDVIEQFLADYSIIDLTENDFDWAFKNMEGDDYEDALQVSVAVRAGIGEFVTFDKALAKRYFTFPGLTITQLK